MAEPGLERLTSAELLARAEKNDEAAAKVLVERYMARLVALVRVRLARRLARRVDAEDIVLSAWRSFFVGARQGKWTATNDDADQLWPLLVTITLRKLSHEAERQQAQRRSAAREESLDEMAIFADDPTPLQAVSLLEELELLLAGLSPEEQQIVALRLQGRDSEAIARDCDCSQRTVRRTLQEVKDALQRKHVAENSSAERSWPATQLAAFIGERAERWIQEQAPPATGVAPPPQRAIDYSELELQRLVGEGTFGKVYQARERSTNSRVAVKFLKKTFWLEPRAVEGLWNELKLVASVTHPSIVRVLGWGKSPAGGPFLVLEWIEGPTLAAWARETKPDAKTIAATVAEVAHGVSALHAAGILHGDLTPNNVLCALGGRLVITDFGFSSRLESAQPARGGTLGFFAPEQLCDAFGTPGVQTDVYALGGILYSLLAGRPPFLELDPAVTVAAILSSRAPLKINEQKSNQALWDIALQCLAKEPASRPQSAAEVARHLESSQ